MQRGPVVLFLVASFLGGAATGVLGGDALRAPPPPRPAAQAAVLAPTPSTDPAACGDQEPGQVSALRTAQAEVGALQERLEARELELAALAAEQRRSREAGQRAAERMRALEAEVERLRTELVTVTTERDRLLVELKDTVKRLDEQVRQTEHYKAEARRWKRRSTENLWRSFVAETKVELCDRGTVRRHERCHGAVEEALTAALQDRFEHCVDTFQATPSLGQLAKRSTELPAHAEALPDDRRFATRGWYVQFCDPTLPERGERG